MSEVVGYQLVTQHGDAIYSVRDGETPEQTKARVMLLGERVAQNACIGRNVVINELRTVAIIGVRMEVTRLD